VKLNKRRLITLSSFVFGGAVSITLLYLGFHELTEYMDSPSFCGQICHESMSPEYITHQASPHSTVDCSDCHVGSGTPNLVSSKLDGLRDVVATVTNSYARPIPSPIKSRRPARDTCEQCHWPEKFTGDLVRINTSYDTDEKNTRKIDTRVLKVGGGEDEVGSGIHRHITARVWYVPLDEKRLDIGWVGVENEDGGLTEYIDPERPKLGPELIQNEKRLMDCIDCHNRVTHLFRSPDELVDMALADNSIDDGLPFIKREALKALGLSDSSLEQAYARIEAIKDFYRVSYPKIYLEKKAEIGSAVDKLEEIARLTTFPEMEVDWNTHLDHSGHDEPPSDTTELDWSTLSVFDGSPGCFRCHGNLVAANVESKPLPVAVASNGKQSDILDADCSLCHYSLAAPPSTPLVPATSHPVGGLDDCVLCHGETSIEPFPTDHPWSTNDTCNTCHQAAPVSAARSTRASSEPASAVSHVLDGLEDCLLCHGESATSSLSQEHPWSTNDTCVACHQTAPVLKSTPTSTSEPASEMPHTLDGLDDCLVCHEESAASPFASDHPWSTNDTCAACHQEAPVPEPMPEPASELASEIPHTLGGLEDCFLCHGESAISPIAQDHPWSTYDTCAACHQETPLPAPMPESISAPASSTPHTIVGLLDCLLCHGESARRPFPEDHAGRTDDFCTYCHEPAPVATPPPTTPSASTVPHVVEGLDDCHLCHGESSRRPFPVDHTGRTDDLCIYCHEPAPVVIPPPETPPAPAMPHPIAGYENCLLCHSRSSPLPFPISHTGRTTDLCIFCHEPSLESPSPPPPPAPPAMPHPIAGYEDCLLCHGESAPVPFPDDHAGHTSDLCIFCHEP
jgi:nitrate/TMAO reductase-like tetraheme cytochrome c subunit